MKYQLTSEGVAEIQLFLYNLPDPALQLEASLIQNDFGNWLQNNFELSQQQLVFFDQLSQAYRTFIASETSFAVANRLPIYLIKPETALLRGSKLIRSESRLAANSDNSGGFNPEGDLTYEITYA